MPQSKCCSCRSSCCRRGSKKTTGTFGDKQNSILFNFFDQSVAKTNHVSTCKYTWYNFIFKFLIEQYQRPNNIFFLTVLLCNSIPGLAIVGFGTLITPIIFILVISAIREIIEDIGRSKSDKISNSKIYTLVRQGEVLSLPASKISQGDLVLIRDGDEVPADCLLMISSSPTKTAMVNTASLDGESNLKPRNVIFTQFDSYDKEADLLAFLRTLWGRITAYPPNSNLTLFTGKVSYHWSPHGSHHDTGSRMGAAHDFTARLAIKSMAIGAAPPALASGYSVADKAPGNLKSLASPFSAVFVSARYPSYQISTPSAQDVGSSGLRTDNLLSNIAIDNVSERNEDDDSILNDASVENSPAIGKLPNGYVASLAVDLDLAASTPDPNEFAKDLNSSHGFSIDKADPIFSRGTSIGSKPSRDSPLDRVGADAATSSSGTTSPSATFPAPTAQVYGRARGEVPLADKLDLVSARPPACSINDLAHNAMDTHKLIHFGTDNTLLKGMKLQNTDLAVGAVIYTAYDTRLMMNQTKPSLKLSHVQKRLDRVLLLEILFLVAGVIICGTIAAVKNDKYRSMYPYAGLPNTRRFITFLMRGMSHAILFAYALPMSLFVSLELVRLVQGIFIEMDKNLRKGELLSQLSKNAQDPLPPAKVHCVVKASALIEDLAEVDIIFSDKTGTLTSNEMIFHSFYTLFDGVQCVYDTVVAAGNPKLCTISHSTLVLEAKEEKARVSDLMTYALALCNTIIVNNKGGTLVYQGESPDEIAFAKAAAAFQLVITSREAEYVRYSYSFSLNEGSIAPQQVTVPVTYTFPVVVPFTSARKRMSIVLREEGAEPPEHFLPLISPYLTSGSPCPTPDPRDVVCFPRFSYSRSKRRVFFTPIRLCTVPGNPFLLSKGADSFLLPCCKPIAGENPMNLPPIKAAIDNFSCEGLRTLVWAVKELSPSFLDSFLKTWQEVSIKPDSDPEYISHTKRLEKDLTFLAASAIEDRLADMVPETLATLLSAGIKVWMLTGDKTQTAVNIARSSNLAPAESEWLYLTHEEVTLMEEKLKRGDVVAPPMSGFVLEKLNKSPTKNKLLALITLLNAFEKRVTPTVIKDNRRLTCCRFDDSVEVSTHDTSEHRSDKKSPGGQQSVSDMSSVKQKFTQFGKQLKDAFSFTELYRKKKEYKTTVPYTTVIDSDVFKLIYMNNLHDFLLSVTMHSTAVVCCRLSPEEKALIVTMTRNRDKYITTLAIGDGANDCPMIKSANIGVGIAGNEGLHASNSSDFSLPEFKYLRRLLFVHGHYTHLRNSELIEYCIYKNLILVFVNGLFSGQCLFTSQILFNDMMVTMYNIVLTFLPIFFYALTEHDVKDRILEVHPRVYSVFERKPETNIKSIGLRILIALYHSLCMYFITSFAISHNVTETDGHNMDLTLFGYYLLNEIIFIVTIKICLHTKYWTWATFIALAFTAVAFVILLVLTNYTTAITETLLNTMSFASRTLHFWVTVSSVVMVALLPDVMYTFIRRFYFPNSHDLLYHQYRHLKRNCLGRVLDLGRDIERVEKMDKCLEEVQARLKQSDQAGDP